MGIEMKRLLLGAASLLVLATATQAADLPVYKKAPPPPVEAWNPWMIRLRALGVLPDAGGSSVNVFGVPALSSPNSGLKISDSVVPELDISYFFTKNIAAELILGVTRHTIDGTGSLNGLPIGKAWLLPPTLTFHAQARAALPGGRERGCCYLVKCHHRRRLADPAFSMAAEPRGLGFAAGPRRPRAVLSPFPPPLRVFRPGEGQGGG